MSFSSSPAVRFLVETLLKANRRPINQNRRELSKRIAADPALSTLTVVGVGPGAMPSNLMRERGTPLLRFMADWLLP